MTRPTERARARARAHDVIRTMEALTRAGRWCMDMPNIKETQALKASGDF
jgi:hypothetical protein